MRGKQQKIQQKLAFMSSTEVKPKVQPDEGAETSAVRSNPESQAVIMTRHVSTNRLGTDPYAGWCGRGAPRGFSLSRSHVKRFLRNVWNGS